MRKLRNRDQGPGHCVPTAMPSGRATYQTGRRVSEGCQTGAADAATKGTTMSQEQKAQVVAQAAALLGRTDDQCRQVLAQVWDAAFEDGRLDALDELQDRFCVCMK